ncbi:MAG: hypothetical protein OES24_10075 [Acidimicrobiia bacterium]|nr:hypothetical protein [Acidimicrobiia bacterium]
MESIVDRDPRDSDPRVRDSNVGGRATVSELRARLGPVSLIRQQTENTTALRALPEALAPLASILPMGGVQRGWSVGVDGHGAWTLAMGLAGWLMEADGWMAAVGLEDLGLVGAGEQGVALDRVLMVETPPPDQWPTVVAALVEAMHVVCVRPHHRIGRPEARRLQARAREQQAVLVHLDGGRTWPYPVDLALIGRSQQWDGLGEGHGHLQGRRLLVEVGGRRAPGVGQWAEVRLDGQLNETRLNGAGSR